MMKILTLVALLCVGALSIRTMTTDQGQPKKGIIQTDSTPAPPKSKKPSQNQESSESKAIQRLIVEMQIQEQERAKDRQAQENQTNRDKDTQGKIVEYTRALVWVGVLQGFVLLGTMIVIGMQTRIMQRQSDLLIERERPRIFVKVEQHPEFDAEGTSTIRYKIEYFCPTPAFVEVAEIEAFVETEGSTLNTPDSMPIYSDSPVKQTNTSDEWTPILDETGWAHISEQQLNEGKIILYCRGVIEYRGVHLLPKEPSYKTTFSKKWFIQKAMSGLGPFGYWDDYPDPKTNPEANRNT
ncbi:MAG: hypothetical protein ACHQIK_00645 [Candidatus Acidiferrales bacterium]